MAARIPEIEARDVGGIDELVTVLEVLLAPELFHFVADEAALGVPEDQPRPDLIVDAVEIQFAAETAVITLLGLLDAEQIVVEL